ncbi:histone acetyltransferase KAT6B [Gossypium australe]|uniref:Histone acetyltransferase KAT6B n=1 Tax=Gossypium australe TaxID=47621 RepID=A0A5B6VS16_9ROSI|nr:histone acetyltransferase KAT6B [Gossypium australe]
MESPHEVKMEMDSINNNDSCYTSSSEDTEPVLDQTSKSPEIHRDQMQKSLNLLVPPKGKTLHTLPYDFNPSPAERPRPEFNLFYSTYNQHRPTSTCSTASDLQVEVSEVGSPPLTTTGSSIDGESIPYDDGDVDRDIHSDGEVWGEANGEKPKELHDIIEEDPVKVDLSDLKMKLDGPNASHQKPMEELNVKPITQRASSVSDSKSYESKTPLESKKMEKCQPGDAPNAVQSRDKLIENNDSGSKQRFDDPIVMALNRRLLIEQVPENKFSSPREKALPVVEQATGAASTRSVEDTKHETERLTEAKANSGLSTSAGESGKGG